jgi:hypothetical protein
MATNPLPPQAYTKETLTQAFAWLQTQNPNLKELATTPDILISLYQKAKLNGEASLWPSVQNFKSELKSLAGMMGEFDSSTGVLAAQPAGAAKTEPASNPIPVPQPSISQAPAPMASLPTVSNQTSKSVASGIDSKSWAMLVEVKSEFNLSSEQEALRLLISLGYKKIKAI